MYREKNLRLLLTILAIVFVVFVPRTTMAKSSGGSLDLGIEFYDSNVHRIDYGISKSIGNLDNLDEDGLIIDFNSNEYKKSGISGQIKYDKINKSIDFVNLNNEKSDYSMFFKISVNGQETTTYNFVGENLIKGIFQVASYNQNGETILTGSGSLNIMDDTLGECLELQGMNYKILNTNIKLQNFADGLVTNYSGETSLQIINSTIDIQSIPPANNKYTSSPLGINILEYLDAINSNITINQKGEYAQGLKMTGGIFNNSSITIDTKGKEASSAITIHENLQVLNSEVYLKSQGIDSKALKSDSIYINNNIKISNSMFQAQGDTDAIYSQVDFNEHTNSVYVKKELTDKESPYPIKDMGDKKKLGKFDNIPSPYRYVKIEPQLNSFNIDADSQPVDQNVYEFVRWEAKGFIIDEPNKKNTKVKIPIILPKDAYIRAIWKKNDGTITVVPETKYETVYKTNTVYDTKTVYKNTLSAMSYLAGYPDNTIKPEGNMTRAEAIATLVRLERLKNNDGRSLQDKDKSPYSDVKDGDWYKKYINFAYQQGWLEEKAGEKFYPDRPITRGELAQLISHVDKKNSAPASFDDVRGHKYEAAINQAYANGRIKGYEDGSFRPDGKIKRAEVATMLNHLYDRRPDKSFIDKHSNIITSFKDLDKNYWGYYELVEAFEAHEYVINDKGEIEWVRLIDSNVK